MIKQAYRLVNQGELLRFAIVAVVGLVVDISLAWMLSSVFGVNLMLAASAGFLGGAILNYLLHEFWTFRRPECQVSMPRILSYCSALGVVFITRLGVIYVFYKILGVTQSNLTILLVAAILSFGIHYLVTKLIFRTRLQA